MNDINIEIYFLSFLLCFVLFYLFVLFLNRLFVCLFLFIYSYVVRYCNKGLGIVTLQFNIPKELGPVLREARG